jgi:hypothetical protein
VFKSLRRHHFFPSAPPVRHSLRFVPFTVYSVLTSKPIGLSSALALNSTNIAASTHDPVAREF